MVYVRVGNEWVYVAKGETIEDAKARGQKNLKQYGSASVQNESIFQKERSEAQYLYAKQQYEQREAQHQAESMAKGEELLQKSMSNAPMSQPEKKPVYVPPKKPEIIETSVYDRPSQPQDYLTGYGYGISGIGGSLRTSGGVATGYTTQHGKTVTDYEEMGRKTRVTQYPYLVTEEGKTISEPRIIITKQYPSPAVEKGESITRNIWSFAHDPASTLVSTAKTMAQPLALQIAGPESLKSAVNPSVEDITRAGGLALYSFTLGTTAQRVFAPEVQAYEYESPVKVKVKATSGREQILGEQTYYYRTTSPEKLILDDTGSVGISRSVSYTVGRGEMARIGKVQTQELGGEIINFGPNKVVLRKLSGGGVGDSIDLSFEVLANVESETLGKTFKPSGTGKSDVISYLTDTYYPPTVKPNKPQLIRDWLGDRGTMLKTGVTDTLTGVRLKLMPTAQTEAQIMSADTLQRFGLFDVRPVPSWQQGVYDVPQTATTQVLPIQTQGLKTSFLQANTPQISTRTIPKYDTDLKVKVLQQNVPQVALREELMVNVGQTVGLGQSQLVSPKALLRTSGVSRTTSGADMSAPYSLGFRFPTPSFNFNVRFPTLQLGGRRPRAKVRKRTRRTYTRQFFYVPSLTAMAFDIRGLLPRNKVFSGAELRPIPKKRRKKRKK